MDMNIYDILIGRIFSDFSAWRWPWHLSIFRFMLLYLCCVGFASIQAALKKRPKEYQKGLDRGRGRPESREKDSSSENLQCIHFRPGCMARRAFLMIRIVYFDCIIYSVTLYKFYLMTPFFAPFMCFRKIWCKSGLVISEPNRTTCIVT